jgi:hypothetical protein
MIYGKQKLALTPSKFNVLSTPKFEADHISWEEWDAVVSPPLSKRMLQNMRPCRETIPPEIFAKLTKECEVLKAPPME